ncbi:MAG: molybdenum cofactor guanylyltransferase [Gammaproteobacteria bacterium]|nr:molybdenum cofactor guanylyltransferase [Gammaproteobacteria bacterium]
MSIHRQDITAVILAGGQGRRMGGRDKGLLDFEGRPLVATLIDRLEEQALDIVINANRNHADYQRFGHPVISDQLADYQGPLAGFAVAMSGVDTDFILTLPCDSPLLVEDYARRFLDSYAVRQAPLQVAFDGERLQPVHALIKVDLLSSLKRFLDSGERKIDRWYAQHEYARVDFSDCADMFRNINTPADQASLQTGL